MTAQASVIDLASVGMGFADEVHDSQTCFRTALKAISHPGFIVPSRPRLEAPAPLHASAAALLHDELELPRLARFDWGSDEYPDRSATVIVQVEQLQEQGSWRLTGPGIEHARSVRAGSIPLWFVGDWENLHASFPRGVDLFLCAAGQLMALPRTTRITLASESCTSR